MERVRLRAPWMASLIAALLRREVSSLYRRRAELLVAPIVTYVIAMAVTPLGLKLYGSAIGLERVVIPSFIMLSVITASVSSSAYFALELSTEAFEAILQAPLPLHLILALRALASTILTLPIPLTVLALAAPYIPVRIDTIAVSAASAVVTGLGVTGFIGVCAYWAENPQKLSLAVSVGSAALTYLSPLYYPLHVMPKYLQYLLAVNPPTLPIEAVRATLTGGNASASLAGALGVNVSWLLAGLTALKLKAGRR